MFLFTVTISKGPEAKIEDVMHPKMQAHIKEVCVPLN